MLKGNKSALWVGVMVLLLAACGPAATPSPAPEATVPRAQATATPRPTAAPETSGSAQPKYGGVLRTVGPTGSSWDPFISRFQDPQIAMSFIHTKLSVMSLAEKQCTFWPNSPQLGESWSWVNDSTLDLKVRPGVKFQNLPPMNGRELTAADVAYTVNEQWKKKAGIAPSVVLIDRAEAVDKYTARFYLKQPFPLITDKIDGVYFAWIIGPEMFAGGAVQKGEQNIGLGPFMFKSHTPGVKTEFKRNPDFFRTGLPYLDGVEMLVMDDVALQVAALRAGKLDWLYVLTPFLNVELESTMPKLKVADCPGPPSGYALYMLYGKPPFDDIRVRRAISMALDRKGVAEKVMQGKGIVLYSSVFTTYPEALKLEDYPPEVRQWLEYNPQRARQLMAEAGYPDGFRTAMYTQNIQPERNHTETASALLADIGIRADIKMLTATEYNEQIYGGKFQEGIAVARAGSGDVHTNLYDPYHSSAIPARNRARIVDPKLDKMLDEYTMEKDPNRRKELARQIQIYTVDQAYLVFFPREITGAYAMPWVKNLYYRGADVRSQGDYLFRVWLDK
ncbi:MAG: hypothetical protein HYY01_12360 [Chloroflexi bacterium]|nr:hypothetical protein [Chloroflexota bacterium]